MPYYDKVCITTGQDLDEFQSTDEVSKANKTIFYILKMNLVNEYKDQEFLVLIKYTCSLVASLRSSK